MQKKSTKSHVSQPKTKLKKNYEKPTSWHILTVLGIYCQILAKKAKTFQTNTVIDHDHQVELGVSCQLDKQGGEPDDRGLMILPLTVSDQ